MQEAAVVLSVLRERGRKGLPLTQLYRQMFNRDLYLLYGNIYSNQGAMTPGASEHGIPSLPAISAGERADLSLGDWWSGTGSNCRPSAFQAAYRFPAPPAR
jgi:hypothetical protein